jgi:methionyl-tRNA synthetase
MPTKKSWPTSSRGRGAASARKSFFLTGLDEHGQKVQQAARRRKKNAAGLLRRARRRLEGLRQKTGTDQRRFRPHHRAAPQGIRAGHFPSSTTAGHFYKATYTGFYSAKEETFLDGKRPPARRHVRPSYGEVVELKEDNYYFKLGAHQQWLIDYIEANPDFIAPSTAATKCSAFLKTTRSKICASRVRRRG